MISNNSRAIKRGWIEKASSEPYKYNVGFIRAVEEWTQTEAADYRTGADTGIAPERHNFDE
jgi:hypothetical protein